MKPATKKALIESLSAAGHSIESICGLADANREYVRKIVVALTGSDKHWGSSFPDHDDIKHLGLIRKHHGTGFPVLNLTTKYRRAA